MRIRRLLAWGLSGGLAVVTVWAAGDHLAHGDTFQVTEVSFIGNQRAPDRQLRHLSDIRDGMHLFKADLARAVHGVEKHPWVAEASARRRFPSTVEIHVREYEPQMLVALDGLWYADKEGDLFKQATSKSLDFPVLTGLSAALASEHPAVARRVIRRGLATYRALSADTPVQPEMISEIHFDQRRGYTLVLRSGTRIVLGFAEPQDGFERLSRMIQVGLDLQLPQVVDLGVGRVAIATPLPNGFQPPQ
jgi:cell division septal protein FtsQ